MSLILNLLFPILAFANVDTVNQQLNLEIEAVEPNLFVISYIDFNGNNITDSVCYNYDREIISVHRFNGSLNKKMMFEEWDGKELLKQKNLDSDHEVVKVSGTNSSVVYQTFYNSQKQCQLSYNFKEDSVLIYNYCRDVGDWYDYILVNPSMEPRVLEPESERLYAFYNLTDTVHVKMHGMAEQEDYWMYFEFDSDGFLKSFTQDYSMQKTNSDIQNEKHLAININYTGTRKIKEEKLESFIKYYYGIHKVTQIQGISDYSNIIELIAKYSSNW